MDNMEDIFELPERLQGDERLVRWHAEIVTRLRREAQGLPMKTIQTLLLERIAYNYVQMRSREIDETTSARERREESQFWMSMTQEFNRLLEKHQDKLLNKVIDDVQRILDEVLPDITDKTERQQITRKLTEMFANLEL